MAGAAEALEAAQALVWGTGAEAEATALDALEIRWDAGQHANVSTESFAKVLQAGLEARS